MLTHGQCCIDCPLPPLTGFLVSKPFVINPWMLDQADRLVAYAIIQNLPMPSPTSWGFLEGFRRASQDIERIPGKWLNGWHPLSRTALEKAKAMKSPLQGLPVIAMNDLLQSEKMAAFAFERDASGRLDKRLASDLIETRDQGKQAWIKLPSGMEVSPLALEGALRIGAAWWCEPACERAAWDGYVQEQSQWSDTILRSSEWDQWVWPWCNLVEQGLRMCLHGKKPSAARFGFPEGWKDRRVAAWGTLGMKVWQSASEVVPEWEDLWIGLLCDRVGLHAALADKK